MTRTIYKSGGADSLQSLLEAICIAELLSPSKELWIYAAWISDFVVIDNRKGTISNLIPELPQDQIRLTKWLRFLAESGTVVRLRTNKDIKNGDIRERIHLVCAGLPFDRIQIREHENLHDKGMIGDGYFLRGSFNFTANGVVHLDEHAEYSIDPDTINKARIEARNAWKASEN